MTGDPTAESTAEWLPIRQVAALTGRTVSEIGRLSDAGEIEVRYQQQGVTTEGAPYGIFQARLAEVQRAPRRPRLRVVDGRDG